MFVPITDTEKPLPGDYIQYRDAWGNAKGSGILLKHVIDKKKPLTESYYLLKNASTGQIWKAYCDRYDYYFMRHKPRNSDLGQYIRGLLVEQEGREKPDGHDT